MRLRWNDTEDIEAQNIDSVAIVQLASYRLFRLACCSLAVLGSTSTHNAQHSRTCLYGSSGRCPANTSKCSNSGKRPAFGVTSCSSGA